ncbi:unnamed protein product [Mytilus coruscus]|uniref:Uncharacterized protein n=1 Tax=Mytilus coruscus TaxID=42192 RepID=A0A6J8CYN7_MYTCO|nr:unnamed protein product [Mytilus coruscus]
MSILTFMKERSPFNGDSSLQNIEFGVTADSSVNVDNSKDVGTAIIESLVGQNVSDYTFKKKKKCTNLANGLFEDISEIFKYEPCSVPSSLFDNNGLPRQANKSILADAIWDFDGCGCLETATNVHHVLDDGSLIHRIPWTKGNSFNSIFQAYVDYIKSHYTDATIVFDGYPDVPTVKDFTHIRRSKGCISPKINFSAKMPYQARLFLKKSSKAQVVKAGEEVLVELNGGVQSVEGLDLLRYRKFASKVVVGNIFVQVHSLPPTSDAAKLYSMRTFYQTQIIWIGERHDLDPNHGIGIHQRIN